MDSDPDYQAPQGQLEEYYEVFWWYTEINLFVFIG